MIEGDRSKGGFFTPDQPLMAWQLNDLASTASRGLQIPSTESNTAQGPFGTLHFAQQQVITGTVLDYPFKVTCVPNETGAKLKVYVRPGTVNNRIPKIGTKYIDDKDAPFVEFASFPSTGSVQVAIKATKDGVKFFPNTLNIEVFEDGVIPADTDNNGYLVIATITGSNVGGKPVVSGLYQTAYSSQVVVRAKPGLSTAVWSWTSR